MTDFIHEIAPLTSSLEQFGDFEYPFQPIPDTIDSLLEKKGIWTIASNCFVYDNPINIQFMFSQDGWSEKAKELRASLRLMKIRFKRRGFNIDVCNTRQKIMEMCYNFHVQPIIDMMVGQMMENGAEDFEGLVFYQCLLEMGIMRQNAKTFFHMVRQGRVSPRYKGFALTHKKYNQLMQTLKRSTFSRTYRTPNEAILEAMAEVAKGGRKLSFINNPRSRVCSNVSWDDDKYRLTGKTVRATGWSVSYHRSGRPGPHAMLGTTLGTTT